MKIVYPAYKASLSIAGTALPYVAHIVLLNLIEEQADEANMDKKRAIENLQKAYDANQAKLGQVMVTVTITHTSVKHTTYKAPFGALCVARPRGHNWN